MTKDFNEMAKTASARYGEALKGGYLGRNGFAYPCVECESEVEACNRSFEDGYIVGARDFAQHILNLVTQPAFTDSVWEMQLVERCGRVPSLNLKKPLMQNGTDLQEQNIITVGEEEGKTFCQVTLEGGIYLKMSIFWGAPIDGVVEMPMDVPRELDLRHGTKLYDKFVDDLHEQMLPNTVYRFVTGKRSNKRNVLAMIVKMLERHGTSIQIVGHDTIKKIEAEKCTETE